MGARALDLLHPSSDVSRCKLICTLSTCQLLACPEASCVSQILTAKAVAADMGESRAVECGVHKWASCGLRNSERDVHSVVKRQGTRLDVEVSEMSCDGHSLAWISPETWLAYLVRKGLWPKLAGVKSAAYDMAREVWTEFWRKFRILNEDHELWSLDLDLSRTAAFLVHGDEGRTLKKGGLMVTSLQSALGNGWDNKRVQKLDRDGVPRLSVNFAGHSFTTRFVSSALPKTAYETNPKVFYDAMEHLAKSLKKTLVHGYLDPCSGERYHIAIVGAKGDQPYLTKLAGFYRSFNTTAKRGDERSVAKGICPYCCARMAGFPAEDLGTTNPAWLPTVSVKLPWLRTPALIQELPHNPGDPAAYLTYFHSDIWHIVHLGIGKSWTASTIQLILPMLPLRNLDEKWEFLTSHYRQWCRAHHRQAHVTKITPVLMSYGDHSGAVGAWSKGALTHTFLSWLVDLLAEVQPDPDGLLRRCREGSYRMNAMFSMLFRADAFLTHELCSFVSEQGLCFLQLYSGLARRQFDAGRQWLFPLYPKLHIFHHIMLRVLQQGRSFGFATNPLMHSCQMDEDTVGRVSRISRRVNIRKVASRSLDRYLINAYAAFEDAGWLA